MHKRKVAAFSIALLLTLFVLAGCGSSSLIGSWRVTGEGMLGSSFTDQVWEFRDDGTLNLETQFSPNLFMGRWEARGNNLVIITDGGNIEGVYSLDGSGRSQMFNFNTPDGQLILRFQRWW